MCDHFTGKILQKETILFLYVTYLPLSPSLIADISFPSRADNIPISYNNLTNFPVSQQGINIITFRAILIIFTNMQSYTLIRLLKLIALLSSIKGAFKYYVSNFSQILDPPPPPASAVSAQALTPHPPLIC